MRDIGRGRGNEGYREMDERGGEGMRDNGRWMREGSGCKVLRSPFMHH